jgi:mannose-6-phosphate isomerase-like protein (cupin superfamily)
MGDYTVKKIDEIDAIMQGGFKRARADLGVASFGMQILEMPAGYDGYPEHDHAETGQEEVYLVLRGSAKMIVDGETVQIDPDTIIRVGPGAKRKIVPGDQGVRFLALGGTPGAVYEAPEITKLGAPDPFAAAASG